MTAADKPVPVVGARVPAVVRRVADQMVKRGVRGLKELYATNRPLALALKREREALLTEVGGDAAPASARLMVDALVRTKVLVDTLDAVLLEIGPGVINRKKKFAYPLLQQRMQLADSLATQMRAFTELKVATELEQRIAALEETPRVVPR